MRVETLEEHSEHSNRSDRELHSEKECTRQRENNNVYTCATDTTRTREHASSTENPKESRKKVAASLITGVLVELEGCLQQIYDEKTKTKELLDNYSQRVLALSDEINRFTLQRAKESQQDAETGQKENVSAEGQNHNVEAQQKQSGLTKKSRFAALKRELESVEGEVCLLIHAHSDQEKMYV